ncbi:Spo0B domain-containing protein [Paenibacillus caui]|uniref:Spo0B domain-containing protein n=1 Tax=Paenibacillus caui TaxID=2873927 RepID=UPI001CA9FD76|nr:Spo0B domain-containing protein [Paenibacillus caui]
MKDRKSVTIAAGVLLLVPLVLFYFNKSVGVYLLLCVWVLAVVVGYVAYSRKQQEQEKLRLLESFQRAASATLGHHRHDWMNDLQILYGYVQLGKHDKLLSCLDRIRERMAAESKISKLGIPSLVFYLQSFREMNKSVQLEIRIEEELELGKLMDRQAAEELAETIMETIRAFQFGGRSSWGEIIGLTMSIYREGGEVVVRFEQDGNSGNQDTLRRNVEKATRGKRIYAKDAALPKAYELRMPCGNLNEVKACL